MPIKNHNTLPKSRVNITLNIEKNGAQKQTELPFKLLVMGEFSHQANRSHVGFRDRINVNKSNLNDVLHSLSPKISFELSGSDLQKGPLPIQLNFNHCRDFQPEQILKQIEPLKRLIAARNLLKELKSHLIDNGDLRFALQKILNEKSQAKRLYKGLNHPNENEQ